MATRDTYAPGEICWVDLNAHDMEAAARFYGAIFGWTLDLMPSSGGPPYGLFRLRGKSVAGMGQMMEAMRAAGVPALWNTYVRVDDCAEAERRVRGMGGTVTVPTMDAMGAGSMAFFQDHEGASFAVWQPAMHQGAELRDEPGTLCWLELNAKNPARAKAFYGPLFGWTFNDMVVSGKPYTIIQNGTTGLGGLMAIQDEWGNVPPHWLPYFGANCDATAAKVKAAGGRILAGPMDISPEHGRFVICADPQGGVFACHQSPAASPPETGKAAPTVKKAGAARPKAATKKTAAKKKPAKAKGKGKAKAKGKGKAKGKKGKR